MTMLLPHDHWGNCYDCVYQQTYGQYYHTFTKNTVDVVSQILSNGTILDFGAGTGRLSIPLAEKGYRMIAVDQSVGMINAFRSKLVDQNLNIEIHPCSISAYNGNRADLAMAVFTVLSYITTEDELANSIKNICNHINSSGFFFFDLPGRVFFDRGEIFNIQRDDFKRRVYLNRTEEENIYIYKESTQCLCSSCGQDCKFEEEFKIRYWELEKLDELLKSHGFEDMGMLFPQFANTGSTHKVYKRK
jgi:SAM-dependent methyltransferase